MFALMVSVLGVQVQALAFRSRNFRAGSSIVLDACSETQSCVHCVHHFYSVNRSCTKYLAFLPKCKMKLDLDSTGRTYSWGSCAREEPAATCVFFYSISVSCQRFINYSAGSIPSTRRMPLCCYLLYLPSSLYLGNILQWLSGLLKTGGSRSLMIWQSPVRLKDEVT